jgi:small subunit ribosomal protein S6
MTEEEAEEQVEAYSAVAKEMGAEVVNVDNWGKRRLAFPVNNYSEGYYTVITLDEAESKALPELERRFKVSDSVIRFLSVRIDEALKRAEKFEKRREARQKKRAQARASEVKETGSEKE